MYMRVLVLVHVHTCRSIRTRMCTCIWRLEVELVAFPHCSLSFHLVFSQDLGLTDQQDQLAIKLQGHSASASLELRFQVPTNMPDFFSSERIEIFKWGQKFRSSCLCYRPFTRLCHLPSPILTFNNHLVSPQGQQTEISSIKRTLIQKMSHLYSLMLGLLTFGPHF